MAYALISSGSAGSSTGNNVATSSLDTTGADKIIVGVLSYQGTGTLSDSKGNTWTLRSTAAGTVYAQIYESQDSPTVGSGHTFTYTSSFQYPCIFVLALSGAASTPFDQQTSATGSGTSIAAGSVTPTEDNELVVSVVNAFTSDATIGCDVGTVVSPVAYVAAQHYAGAISYQIQTTATARNPTWTPNGSQSYLSACVVTFKSAAAASGQPLIKRLGGIPYAAGLRQTLGVHRW